MLEHVLAEVFQRERGRILSTLIRWCRNFDEAEDVFQEAALEATRRWTIEGMPANGGAWLLAVAKNKYLDRLRRRKRQEDLLVQLPARELQVDTEEEDALPDDNLRLIFTCCHPVLSAEGSVALTLRTLGGLTTAEIARAFVVPEVTMAQRLVRVKRKISAAGVPYRVPTRDDLPERLSRVLHVVYLIFNEGYAASSGAALLRHGLCAEAIRLTRCLNDWMPGEAEVRGMLALLLLTHARRDARTTSNGELITLDAQDRALWRRGEIDEGLWILEAALRTKALGPFQVQAAIAAVHAEAATAEATNWREIAHLYGELLRFDDSAIVHLNRAVAIGYTVGWAVGLGLLEEIGTLEAYLPYHVARAQFLRRLGRGEESRAAFERALTLSANGAERGYIQQQLTRT
jgi:RNA polymerase sigma-70 factor (ECF subfamily)